MKFSSSLLILICILSISCTKDHGIVLLQGNNPRPHFYDTVQATQYYSNDPIDARYSNIYNTWRLHRSGGGMSSNFDPGFEYLRFKKNGIYCFTVGDSTLEFGPVLVHKQDNTQLILKFSGAPFNNRHVIAQPYVVVSLKGIDTLYFEEWSITDNRSYWLNRIK